MFLPQLINELIRDKKEAYIINRIVYYDYGGSHSSVTAACIHSSRINTDKVPDGDTLMSMPYLDKTTPEDFGKIKHIGSAGNGTEIYSMGTRTSEMGNLLDDLTNIHGISDQYMFVSTAPYVNMVLRTGGWLSRSVSLPALGRPLVISGLRKAFPGLCTLVETIRLKQGGMQQ